MPEGPEVRTVVDQLQGGVGMQLQGFTFLSGRYVHDEKPRGYDALLEWMKQGQQEEEEQQQQAVTDQDGGNDKINSTNSRNIIQEWNAKGKFQYIMLESPTDDDDDDDIDDDAKSDLCRTVWITLGMSGRFINEETHQAMASVGRDRHCRWYMTVRDTKSKRQRNIYYYDTRNFGTLRFCQSRQEFEKKLASLGPDILEDSTTDEVLLNVVANQKNQQMNICKFLMNQSKLSGVGNYILAEGLYRADIDPFCSLAEINETQFRRLFEELRSVARDSYASQGLTRKGGTFQDTNGNKGQFEFELQCYGRDVCAAGNPVIRDTDGPHGRTIWYVEKQLFMSLEERNQLIVDSNSQTGAENGNDTHGSSSWSQLSMRLLNHVQDPSWRSALDKKLDRQRFESLAQFVENERRTETVYPPEHQVFASLNLCPLDRVKVVVVGQDPYHGPGQGHGLAFSVRKGVQIPPSLRNIFQEAGADTGIPPPQHGCLECWADQGVLLLNTVLTVRRGKANSHAKQGWEDVTDAIIDLLNTERSGLVFLLWGNPAHKKANSVDETKHTVIRTSHPSPLGATKTKSPFLGSGCFSRTNEALEAQGHTPIDWIVQ